MKYIFNMQINRLLHSNWVVLNKLYCYLNNNVNEITIDFFIFVRRSKY